MIRRIVEGGCLLLLAGFFFCQVGHAEVDWEVLQILDVKSAPLDVAVSPDGKYIFVLTDRDEIKVFDADGTYNDTIRLGEKMDRLRIGPEGDRLFVSNRENNSIKIIRMDFIQTIQTSGSPFKGPPDAPITIAVFSDFQ